MTSLRSCHIWGPSVLCFPERCKTVILRWSRGRLYSLASCAENFRIKLESTWRLLLLVWLATWPISTRRWERSRLMACRMLLSLEELNASLKMLLLSSSSQWTTDQQMYEQSFTMCCNTGWRIWIFNHLEFSKIRLFCSYWTALRTSNLISAQNAEFFWKSMESGWRKLCKCCKKKTTRARKRCLKIELFRLN